MDSSHSSVLIHADLSPVSLPQDCSGYCGELPSSLNDVAFQHCIQTHVLQWEAGTCFHGKRPGPHCRAAHTAPFLLEMHLFDWCERDMKPHVQDGLGETL